LQGEGRKLKNEELSLQFIKYRLFAQPRPYLLGLLEYSTDTIFVYVDEIVKYVYDKYPRKWAVGILIRLFSEVVIHELAHKEYPSPCSYIQEGNALKLLEYDHRRWDDFLVDALWEEYLR